MDASTTCAKTLLGYESREVKPGVYLTDVLGDRQQTGDSNTEWRQLGQQLAQHAVAHQQSAVLVSTYNLEHFLVGSKDQSTTDNSVVFEHEGLQYIVTSLERSRLDRLLPDITESEEFVNGLNVWLCLFRDGEDVRTSCQSEDTHFIREMKRVITNIDALVELELTIELIAAVPDGIELLWFNPII